MKAILSFKLPEEKEEFEAAIAGGRAFSALHEIRQQIFRPARKHGYQDSQISSMVESINSKLTNVDDPSVEQLMYLLELQFSRILAEYEIPGDI